MHHNYSIHKQTKCAQNTTATSTFIHFQIPFVFIFVGLSVVQTKTPMREHVSFTLKQCTLWVLSQNCAHALSISICFFFYHCESCQEMSISLLVQHLPNCFTFIRSNVFAKLFGIISISIKFG